MPIVANSPEHGSVKVSIVYDGMCPVCNQLARTTRLQDRGGTLELIDARSDELEMIQGNDLSGVDFNEGFAVVVDGEPHLGADGAHVLALLTEPSGLFFRLFRWSMRTEKRSRILYPVLRSGRRLLLKILRIPLIADPKRER